MDSEKRFTWIMSYEAIANALLKRRDRTDELMALYTKLSGDEDRESIDPFTFFTTFNRGIIPIDRRDMIKTVLDEFGLNVPVPIDFAGVPTANHELWRYFDDTPQGAEDCWDLFEVAIELADSERPSAEVLSSFCELFDKVHDQENITKARLTRTLYWMRPAFYLPFGEKARDYMHSRYGLDTPVIMKGIQYVRMLQEMSVVCDDPIYEVTARAYKAANDQSWWPDMDDYDPDMSISQWVRLLSDEETTSREVLAALRKIHEMGDQAAMEDLADERDHDRDYYATMLRDYAKNTARKMGRKDYMGSWWPFVFVGKDNEGAYVWRLRPEIVDAIEELDADA